MKKIGGNKTIEIQIKTISTNEIGEQVTNAWMTVEVLRGFLDMSGGEAKYTYNAKIQESTHLFICDYKIFDERVKIENSRVFDPQTSEYYQITYIDNPSGLNYHYEIYLKYIGGQVGTN